MVKSSIFKLCKTKYKIYHKIFKNTAFNHPPLFYISHSSRLVTFNMSNLEYQIIQRILLIAVNQYQKL